MCVVVSQHFVGLYRDPRTLDLYTHTHTTGTNMWPWGQPPVSSSYQPTGFSHSLHSMSSLPLHCVNPQGGNTQFGTSQSSVPFVGYTPFAQTEYSHSNISGYGITGMNSSSHLTNWNDNVNLSSADHHTMVSPAGSAGTPPTGVSYFSPHNQIGHDDSMNHHMRSSSSLHGTPVTPHAPTPPLPETSPIQHSLEPGALVSPHAGASYQQAPPQPQQIQPNFPSGSHVHNSSPFSVDFLLRERSNNVIEAAGSGSAMRVVGQGEQSYSGTPSIPVDVQDEMNVAQPVGYVTKGYSTHEGEIPQNLSRGEFTIRIRS